VAAGTENLNIGRRRLNLGRNVGKPQGAMPMPAASTSDLKSADIKHQADDLNQPAIRHDHRD
jgi:hypothetical protein